MDFRRERLIDGQIGSSWIPITPSKPGLTEQQPICENQPFWLQSAREKQANWLEQESFLPEFLGESPSQGIAACFEDWKVALTTQSQAQGSGFGIYSDKFSCAELLAMADASASSQANYFPLSGETRCQTTSFADTQFRNRSNFQTNDNAAGFRQYDHSTPVRHSFDLNSPLETFTVRTISSAQFAPLTPDQAKRDGQKQVPNITNFCVNRTNEASDNQEKEVVVVLTDEENHPHHDNERSCAAAAACTEWHESHNPDKEGNQVSELNETPPQKPRRRKHRPKVVLEGQSRRTRKPETPSPALPKRKYVRKNGVEKHTATPSVEVTSGTSIPRRVGRPRKSCRKSLNFDLENEAMREEGFSCKETLNLTTESYAQNFNSQTQTRTFVQLGKRMEVITEKTQLGTAYDLCRSTNQLLENYLSMPERQVPSPATPAKNDPPCEKLMSKDQNECKRGKCRIFFSDKTHDKEGNAVQGIVNVGVQSALKSLDYSYCSSTRCFSKEEQTNGLKRKHMCTSEEAEFCIVNGATTNHNPLQEYLAKYPVNGCKIDQSGAHFPVIYKKKRTKKEQSIASSCASLSMATENRGGQQLTYTPKEQYPNNFSIETACRVSAAQFSNDSCRIKKTGAQDKQGLFNCMLALGNADRLTKKRSKAPSCVRDFNSRVGVLERLPAFPTRGPSSALIQGSEISHHYSSCLEALAAGTRTTMAKRKRTKRKSLVTSVPPNMYNQHMFLPKPIGLLQNKTWKGMADADILVEQFKRLAIGGESTQLANEEQNAVVPYCMRYQDHYDLVLYKRDGTIVPFEGSFDPVKKRRPRPKVDLDPETSRVWKLLLENINNTGIDGTDEEKTKWWEEERSVFRGRADSFIARMHLVQGDRRFSRWKGSVVDSVIGVFLTQNVSDHLSSSAFMSLAARFPLKSEVNQRQPTGDSKCIVEEPDVQVEDPVDSIQWHESNHQPICYQNSITLKEKEIDDEKVDISNASSRGSIIEIGLTDHSKIRSSDYHDICQGMHNESAANESEIVASSAGDQRDMDGTSSSQNSVVSSHNSLDPLSVVSCSWSKSEVELDAVHANNFGDCTSFMELLLQKAGTTALYGIHEQLCGNMPLDKQDQLNQSAHMVSNSLEDNKKGTDEPRNFMGTTSPLDNYHVHLRPNLGEDVLKFFDASADESRISDVLERDDENSSIEQSGLTSDSASQTSVQHIMVVSSQEASRSPSENNYPFINIQSEKDKIVQSQMTVEDPKKIDVSQTQENQCKMQEVLTAPTFSGNTLWNTDTISDIGNSTKGKQKAVEEKLNSNQLSTKIGRSGKGKQSAVDWDNLRKQAQPNGEKRERTVNTMDSLDYEALRCADVNEIADTIKERGMNNVLAERIKAFLNRTVEEHGSIDLEWLRDVPPDKAKEYLLSINGLGLKSVECVRLLTLHHLAFPVDTNVGRIAVRLGWVPLQPLPESLQLHLLELYPVLETIQKYLWPRLCKLDQRTLYELHYQMITFGKVFCTKSKPNCNACPMRGECRHFASAFASARLALPSPEEKSLVSATGNEGANRQSMDINLLQLPEPQANQHLKIHSGVRDIGPIIEVPASPEPVIEVPLTPEPEIIQPRENDIEDTPCEDPDEIPIIKLNMEEFAQTLEQHMKQNMELQEGEMSKALVALTPEAASIPMPKLKNVSRLRTEHQVYELPDSHPLLEGLDKREPDDPCSYLLAIWTPGETADSIQPPESRCASQEFGYPCDDTTCFSCSSTREAYSQTVRGTLLIPCRTAMRGSFPLNGTYFQVNEVFADHESSLNPISVPRAWIWNLPRRTVYFGTSIPTIFKGLSTEDIQYCFWRGFVCVRGFDQKARAPRPLMARLHFPASKLTKTVGKTN